MSSCNYAARACGVRAGMFMGEARRLCPNLHVIPYAFDAIRDVSEAVYRIFLRFATAVQAVSCDEAFLDVSHFRDPEAVAQAIRTAIRRVTRCPASAGVGANILQARLATKRAKPDGQFWMRPDTIRQFFDPLPAAELPGVGRRLRARLAERGLHTCADLCSTSLASLQRWLGEKTGKMLHAYARGEDDRPLKTAHQRKTVGAEVNWGIRFQADHEAAEFLEKLAGEVARRMAAAGVRGSRLTLKAMRRKPDAPEVCVSNCPRVHVYLAENGSNTPSRGTCRVCRRGNTSVMGAATRSTAPSRWASRRGKRAPLPAPQWGCTESLLSQHATCAA